MADALYMIALGIITIALGAKGFFGGVLLLGGLYVLRTVSRFKFKKILPGKSLKIEIDSEDTRIRVAVPLMLLSLAKPLILASSALIESALSKYFKDERLKDVDVSRFINAISDATDVLYTFEGDLVSVESADERIRIHVN